MQMDYYSILGVPKGASEADIKKAYRSLAMKHHPDRGGDQAQFQKIQEAYATLGDTGKRQQYDNPQPQGGGFQFHFNSGDPFADIFSQFGFPGGDPFAQHRQQQRRNKDLRIRINLSLRETLEDQQKTISVQTSTGERQTVNVQIPKGVTTGSSIKYPGLGDNMFNTLPRGDLYVTFVIEADPLYHVDGINLVYNLQINVLDAMIGSAADVPSIEGRVFNINIPAGTTHQTKFRIPNQGLYSLDHNGHIRGSLIVNIEVIIPQVTTQAQISLIQQLRELL
jgi:DnaJ-class molecular chaperone